MEKSYRIHTKIASDTVLNVNMQQDFDFLEVLSLKLRQADAYKLHSSNYGVIVGRVLANDAFGIPNAKVSVFVERDDSDSTELENIYPYTDVTSKDSDDRRYNLLPDYSDDSCYRVVGTFPNKRLLLDDDAQVEVYDKYWKYTTVTNQAGDYMLFGVPTGSQTVHVDLDLSDIGILSQKPRDLIYQGHDETEFDSSTQFKESTNLDNSVLSQIHSQDKSVNVYPFWGDTDNGIAAITRNDVQINYKFEPTCVFMGSIISDNDSNSIGHDCRPSKNNGMNDQLIAGNGTIEMIRKTTDGLVEEYPIQGNQLIDENGVWCYQIPMNLDYIGTDEYGNVVATDNADKGIPTRAQVRFRFSKTETGDEGFSRHTAKYLVPMNPIFSEKKVIPTIDEKGSEIEKMYNFGSNTPDSCFRDLYWNNVYSVKNYIPKAQRAHRSYSAYYTALKGANLASDQNEIPFNKLRVDLPFSYMLICILVTIVMWIITFINSTFICVINLTLIWPLQQMKKLVGRLWPLGKALQKLVPAPSYINCISLSAGLTEGNVTYFPGCYCKEGMKDACCAGDSESNNGCDKSCRKSSNTSQFMDKVQRNLALEYKIIKLDFYHDWINGVLYMPLWYWRKRKKKTFLFGLFSKSAKNDFCSCNSTYSRLKTKFACSIGYTDNSLSTKNTKNSMDLGHKKWHKSSYATDTVSFKRGLINPVVNKEGLTAYYYAALQINAAEKNANSTLDDMPSGFTAVRLYATDIILLGNLNEDNLYGIPQFYKCLPSTTANIPPIATVQEEENVSDDDTDYDTSDSEESGVTTTTGMDWGYTGDKQKPLYKDGLFMDLACTSIKTRAKACVNVERLSELGSNLDIQYSVEKPISNQLVKQTFETDGFINKLELDDMDNRAMFATLNHIGFVPQNYQDLHESYTTQIEDENTSYLVNKFKYIYPVNFDGRLEVAMSAWKNGFGQALSDNQDQSYITFRLGAENDEKYKSNSEERIRHFYVKNNGRYALPLYNNSYYFYFGAKKGNTAIDKFNKMFVADCVSSSTSPFTIVFSKQGASSCPSMYANKNNAYGWIKVILDDIQAPYSYTLYDSFNNEVITENDLSLEYFVIGGKSDTSDGDVAVNQNGAIHYQKDDSELKDSSGHIVTLSNQEYAIEITDSNGKIVSTKVALARDNINVEYNTSKLGTKFYNTQDTKVEDICNGDTLNNGIISISSVTIDGYQCTISNVQMDKSITSGVPYTFSIFCHNDDNIFIGNVAINITLEKISSDNSGDTVYDCLCDKDNGYKTTSLSYSEPAIRDWSLFFKDGTVKIYVYQPCTIQATNTISACTNNISYNTITVSNGSTFNTYLNGMPIRFMLGTLNDDINMTVSNQSNFYSTTPITDLTQQNIAGWFAVNDENAYKFPSVNQNNFSIWEDYVTYDSNDISDLESEYDTLVYKFNHMFSLSNAIFVTSNSSETLKYSYDGGVNPILNRTVSPYYSDTDEMLASGTYVLTDDESVNIDRTYPLVVGNNYSGITSSGPQFNSLFKKNTNLLGHYFAAFDRDGGYTSKNKIDSTINVKKLPSYAAVNPKKGFVKTIGTDVTGTIDNFQYVYNQNKSDKINPYLRAMTIDRTLSYNITILPPLSTSMPINTKLDDKNKDADWVCKTARIFGTIYGGIEMAYDSEYNIIDGDVAYDKGNISAVTPNNRLEYTYTVTSGQTRDKIACTRYNNRNSSSLTDCVWESDTDRPTSPLIKRFYLAQMGDTDIRNFFWSNFNKTRLTDYIKITEKDVDIKTRNKKLYLWKYPLTKDGQDKVSYNGDFDPFDMDGNFKQSWLTSNYPSKRSIDISGIEGTNDCNLQIQSCGYDMSCSYTDTNTLKCTVSAGETEEISVTYDSPIHFAQTSGDSTIINALYQLNTKGSDSENYSIFESNQLYLNFSYADYSVNGFDVISCCPLLIKILPLTNGIDGVSYYKSFSPVKQNVLDKGWASGETTLNNAIKKVTSFAFNVKAKNTWWDRLTNASVILPDSTEIVKTDDVYIKTDHVTTYHFKDTESSSIITNDDDKFSQISFKRTITNNDIKMFAIGVYRFCFSQSDTFTAKNIRMFSTTKPYDCRPIRLKVANGESKTYILKESADTYKQFVTFTLKYNKVNNDPVNADCQVFEDKDVEYSCEYNINGTTYQMQLSNPTVTSSSSATYLEFKSEWSQDGMNTFVECKNNKCTCSIYVQGDDNFTYGLSSFTLQATNPQKPTIIDNVIATSVKIS